MNKKEISEIKKQFTPDNCAITRICGCYVDGDKNKKAKLNEAFLSLTEEEMFQIDRGIQIGYGIKNNVYDYDNEEDSFVKDIANYIQEMDHLLSKLCDLKELDQKARHIDIEQLLGKDVIALGRILPDSGLEAVRAAMVSQADKEQKKIREKLELMIGKR